MSTINQITVGSTTYDIEDSVARGFHHLTPISTKTYSNFIATSNDNVGGGFFYLKVRSTTYTTKWHVKVRVIASVINNANYYTDTTFDVYGFSNTYSWYSCVNDIRSTSYRSIYYNSLFFTNETGYNNDCGHWIGVNLYNATNPTDSSYKREITVELLAAENCTTEFADNLITPTNIPNRSAHTDWYTSTNTSFSNFDACNYGLKQSGDSNTTSINNLIRGGGNFIMDSVLYRYQMLFQKDENTLTPLNNVSNSTGTSKTMLTNVEFDPFGWILYYTTTTTVSANTNVGGGNLAWAWYGIDLRYTFNCGTTLTSHLPFYLVVTPTSNGKCKIASSSPWSQTLPTTNDGKWYIYLGRTYSTYQLAFYPNHPVYYHDGTSVKQIFAQDFMTATSTLNGLMSAADKVTLDNLSTGSVPSSRTINGHALSSNISLTASDVGAMPSTYTAPVTSVNGNTGAVTLAIPSTAADVGAVPTTRKVNNKALSSDITLTAADVGALASTYTAPVSSVNSQTGAVVLAIPSTASDVGAVPTSRTINGYDLSSNVTLTANDIGALPSTHTTLYYTNIACTVGTGDIATVSNAAISSNHVVANISFANPSYITTDVTWATSTGELLLSGACNNATTAEILLVLKDN